MLTVKKRWISLLLALLTVGCTVGSVPVMPTTAATVTGYDRGYTGGAAGTGQVMAQGLDVSSYQKDYIDFADIKAAGYSYVILRCGTTYGKDTCFEDFYAQARGVGLDIGAYYYSYALTAEEALSDAKAALSYIAGKTFEYPVYMDYEDASQKNLSDDLDTAICLTFLDKIAGEGYLAGLYTYKNFSKQIPLSTICAKYEFWIAHYYDHTYTTLHDTYSIAAGMYQYTSSKQVENHGPYDANVAYKDYPAIVKKYGFNGYFGEEFPVGAVDGAVGGVHTVRVHGWAFDGDDTAQSIPVRAYVGGPVGVGEEHAFVTDLERPDVNETYGIMGNHGFDVTFDTQLLGQQPVYVYAINIGGGDNRLIGQYTVTIQHIHAPVSKGNYAATYDKAGLTGRKVCSVCGTVMNKGKTIAKKKMATPKVTIANSATGITVKWNRIAGATGGYWIYRREVKNGKWTGWTRVKGRHANATSWVDTTAKNGVQYRYTVRGTTGKTLSPFATTATLRRLTNPAVKVSKVSKGIKVSWNKNTAATGYWIYRREVKDGKWTGWKRLKGRNAPATSWTDTTAKKGVTYRYTVRTANGSHLSHFTSTGNVKR